MATGLARELGVNSVAQALGLDYNVLKRHVLGRVAPKAKVSPAAAGPAFVELAVDAVARRPECVVEFEGRRGKLTIRLAGHSPADVVALAETLSRPER